MIRAQAWLLLLLLTLMVPAAAHEVRPAYLEILQEKQDDYVVRFKVPARGDMRLSLRVRLPANCANVSAPRSERAGSGIMDHLHVVCPGGLDGREIAIDGLASTFTDVIVRVARADGTVQSTRLTPTSQRFLFFLRRHGRSLQRRIFYLASNTF